MTTKKQVNDILRGRKNGPHEDKREKSDREFNNQRVRELIEEMRRKRGSNGTRTSNDAEAEE